MREQLHLLMPALSVHLVVVLLCQIAEIGTSEDAANKNVPIVC